MNDNDLECLLLFGVKLLTASDLLDELLNDDLVMHVCFAGSHLDVEV